MSPCNFIFTLSKKLDCWTTLLWLLGFSLLGDSSVTFGNSVAVTTSFTSRILSEAILSYVNWFLAMSHPFIYLFIYLFIFYSFFANHALLLIFVKYEFQCLFHCVSFLTWDRSSYENNSSYTANYQPLNLNSTTFCN